MLLASASQNETQLLMQTENYFNQSDKKDVIEIAIRCLQINLYDASINFHPHLCLCQKSLNKKNQSISRIFLWKFGKNFFLLRLVDLKKMSQINFEYCDVKLKHNGCI